jgi:thiol-disulfide isomerase/thioredoxin|tara:strand:- start:2048 stop:2551 length:504 start_codon:yes stop_codon:yes gene_type:complete
MSSHASRLVLPWLILWASSILALEKGDSAPQFELPALDSSASISLSDFRGKVVYLDFWASWCGPCRLSLPLLDELRQELGDQGFEVVAVDVDEQPEDGRLFLQKYPVSYPVASDPTGLYAGEYELVGMPSSFLIDRRGVVRAVHQGFKKADMEKIRLQVQLLLEEDA